MEILSVFMSYFLALVSACPSLVVYREGQTTELSDSALLFNDTLMLKVGVSSGVTAAYSSLGLSPQLSFCHAQTSTGPTSVWSPGDQLWSATIDASGCGLECCLSVQLESMTSRCELMTWRGHFLRVSEAPLLQWLAQLSEEHLLSSDPSPSPPTLSAHLQCSPQVAIVIRGQELSHTINWFSDPSNSSLDICSLAEVSPVECADLQLEDLTITHWALFLLTSAGLYKSDVTSGKLVLQDVPFIALGGHFLEQSALFCLDPIIADETVRVVVRSGGSVVAYSSDPPYTDWSTQTTLCTGGCGQLLVTYDSQRGQYITTTTENDFVVRTSSGQAFGNVTLSHMFYHPTSSAVYLLGTQVWLSLDGGVTFNPLVELSDHVINYSYNDRAVLLLTASGGLYFTRPGGQAFTQLSPMSVHSLSRIALDDYSTLRIINLNNVTSQVLERSAQVVGPCSLSYDRINPQLLYLHDNHSNCSVADLIGYRAEDTSLGSGLVITLGWDALVATATPVPSTSGSGEGVWSFREEQCWTALTPMSGIDSFTHELDVWDSVVLQVMATTTAGLPRHFLDITVSLGHPELFDLAVTSMYTSTTHTLTATLWQRNITAFPVHSTVTFHLVHCLSVCETCTLSYQLLSSCPSGKHLRFLYPTSQSPEQLYTLPVNYRPPSALGMSIHSSPHVYNVDPGSNINTLFSEVDVVLKQCLSKSNRADCDCSGDQYNSTDISASDCIQKVYRHLYEATFQLTFELSTTVGTQVLTTPVQLEELNSRSDFTINTNHSVTSSIRFKGPGLFHFEAVLLNATSFCQLSTQFTVFVEHTPLPKVGELTVTTLTTVVFGLLTIVTYLLHYLRQRRKLSHSRQTRH